MSDRKNFWMERMKILNPSLYGKLFTGKKHIEELRTEKRAETNASPEFLLSDVNKKEVVLNGRFE